VSLRHRRFQRELIALIDPRRSDTVTGVDMNCCGSGQHSLKEKTHQANVDLLADGFRFTSRSHGIRMSALFIRFNLSNQPKNANDE